MSLATRDWVLMMGPRYAASQTETPQEQPIRREAGTIQPMHRVSPPPMEIQPMNPQAKPMIAAALPRIVVVPLRST